MTSQPKTTVRWSRRVHHLVGLFVTDDAQVHAEPARVPRRGCLRRHTRTDPEQDDGEDDRSRISWQRRLPWKCSRREALVVR
jgi:hypothetical protein